MVVAPMRAHELAQWLLERGDFPIFLFTGPGDDDTFAAVGAFQGSVELRGGKQYPFVVLASVDLSQDSPEAPSFVPPPDETVKSLLSD